MYTRTLSTIQSHMNPDPTRIRDYAIMRRMYVVTFVPRWDAAAGTNGTDLAYTAEITPIDETPRGFANLIGTKHTTEKHKHRIPYVTTYIKQPAKYSNNGTIRTRKYHR